MTKAKFALRGYCFIALFYFIVPSAWANAALSFDDGIGFYWEADGQTHFLYWTDDPKKATENDVITIPENARFFSYGLQAPSLPPHLVGYGMEYRSEDGELHGRYPARFLPMDGYEQPVYQISLPTHIVSRKKYKYFTLTVPATSVSFSGSGRQAYIFHYADEEYKARQQSLKQFVYDALSNDDVWYDGELSKTQIIFDAGTHEFQIRFLDFDARTGQLEAVAKGVDDNRSLRFTGQLTGFRRLVLRHDGGDIEEVGELEWDLTFDDRGVFSGSYAQNMSINSVSIDLGTPNDELDASDASDDVKRFLELVVPNGGLGALEHGTGAVAYYDEEENLVDIQRVGKGTRKKYESQKVLVHPGIDLVANTGTPIYPVADGVVHDTIDSEEDSDFEALGYMVLVKHNTKMKEKTVYSIYLHLSEPPLVNVSDKVVAGDTQIGFVGETGAAFGSHVHIETRLFSERYHPQWKNIYGPLDKGMLLQTDWVNPIEVVNSR